MRRGRTQNISAVPAEGILAPLELELQELDPRDAPGFWENFKDGVLASLAVSAVSAVYGTAAASTAASVAVT
jgi:hypothetical protein